MWYSRIANTIGSGAQLLSEENLESIPWRRIAVDAGLLALFLLTSSWFAR